MKRGAVFVVFILFSLCAQSEEFAVSAKAAALLEYETGRGLYAQNADERLPIASTTKIMTCLLALENADLSDIVAAGPNASGVPGTSIYLSAGETLTMEEMLYGMMLRSGNDAAVAVAEHVAGSVAEFADMMNARAARMNLNAYFTTPNGLDEGGNGASARAVAEIAREALRLPAFREIVGTQRKIIPWADHEYARVLTNKNKLLKTYEGALGVKTGFTSRAGRCLVFAAEREGMLLVGAVLNCPNWFEEAARMLDYGFERYTMYSPFPKGAVATEVPVEGSGGKTVPLCAATSLCAPVRADEACEIQFVLEPLRAPVRAGDTAGRAYIAIDGERIALCELVAARDVRKASFFDAFHRVIARWPLWT